MISLFYQAFLQALYAQHAFHADNLAVMYVPAAVIYEPGTAHNLLCRYTLAWWYSLLSYAVTLCWNHLAGMCFRGLLKHMPAG